MIIKVGGGLSPWAQYEFTPMEDNVVQTVSGEIIYPEMSRLSGPSHIREM